MAYTGPGDIVASAWTAWWGLRAFSLAAAGGSALDIIRASDSTTNTFATLANGALDIASITTFLTSTTGKVSKLYDQTGNTNHLVQASGVHQPAFSLTAGPTGDPAIVFDGSSSFLSNAAFPTIAQPYSFSFVNEDTLQATFGAICQSNSSAVAIYWANSANVLQFNWGGAPATASASNSNWHALQFVADHAGGLSDIDVDGAANAINLASSFGLATNFSIGSDNTTGNNFLQGAMTEFGIVPLSLTKTQRDALTNNQLVVLMPQIWL